MASSTIAFSSDDDMFDTDSECDFELGVTQLVPAMIW